MKRVISQQSRTLVVPVTLALALSFGLGLSSGQAQAASAWNPLHWFGTSATETADTQAQAAVLRAQQAEARQRAEQAQEAATRAMQDAQEALRKATEARQAAEALEQSLSKPSKRQKQVVVAPAAAAEAVPTQVAPTRSERVLGSDTESSTAKEPWNPLNWFNQVSTNTAQREGSTTTVNQPAAKVTEPTAEAVKTEQSQSELTTSSETAPAYRTESSAAANTPAKSGGWNLLNLLSKPGQPEQDAVTESPAKTAPESPEIDSATLDQVLKTKAALIETERGNIAIELYSDQAPLTVANFVKLINSGFYNRFNMKFHRVVPGFVVQTGDPTGTGAGGSKERVPLEAKNKLSHNTKGIVAMARGADPNSATSQFYITLAPQTSLDGKYAIFGKVISGIDVVGKIEQDDQLYGIRLVDLSTVVRDVQPEKKNFFSSIF